MRVTFLGDVHGRWESLQLALEANPDTDLFIQLGDFGIFSRIKHFPPNLKKPVFFIDGNHDDHPYLQKRVRKGKLRIAENCWYIPRGSQLRLGNTVLNCLGGADSIDKHYRTLGIDWWKEENPSQKELQKFADLSPAEIVLTHTVPQGIIDTFGMSKIRDYVDPTSVALEQIRKQMDYTPKYWLFGHWHQHYTFTERGTTFKCIPCTHDFEVSAYTGLTMEI